MGWIGICGRMEFDCSSQFDKFAGSTLTHEKGFFCGGKSDQQILEKLSIYYINVTVKFYIHI